MAAHGMNGVGPDGVGTRNAPDIYIYIYIQVARIPRIIHNILMTYLHGEGVGEEGGEVSEQ